jgi:signal transduction histidine kinase/CheY-like chemotaxis protein
MRTSLKARMAAIATVASLALIVLVAVGSMTATKVEEHLVDIRDHYLPKVGLQNRLEAQLERVGRGLQDAVAASDRGLLKATRTTHEQLLAELAAAGPAVEPAAGRAALEAIDAYFASAYRTSERLIDGETGEAIVEDMADMQAKLATAADLLRTASAFDARALQRAFAEADRIQRAASQVRLVVSGICLIVVIILSIGISRSMLRSVADLTAGLTRFGDGDFSTAIPTRDDELGQVAEQANQMAARLDRLGAERTRIDWLKTGQAGLADELRGDLEPGEVADRALGFLLRYLGVPVGAIYETAPDLGYDLLGTYAGAGPGEPRARFGPREGLIGQAAGADGVTVVPAPPDGDLRISSGVVDGRPSSLVFVPLLHAGRVAGVLELGVVDAWTEARAELVLAIRDTVAIAIVVARARVVLRQTNEALIAQAREVEAQRKALEERNAELVDARRRLEQRTEQIAAASTYKSQFLANMSHELRTPLNAIIGFAELLHDGAVSPDTPEHKEFLGDILTSGRHLLQLINDVLDLSKVEAGKLDFHPEPASLTQIIGEVLAILRTTAADKRITVTPTVAPEIDRVTIDPARFKQVLYNYASNALKFTPEDGRIEIRATAADGDRFRLEVEDTGIGIAPDDVGRLFVEFQQIDGGIARRQSGTGLGLALTRRLVEAQGGEVGVESQPGKGSTFSAVLPRRATVTSSVEPPVEPIAVAGGPTVLIVEDNAADQRQLVAVLSQAGYAVEVAASGARALQRCREQRFDAITLDLLLPDISGLEVLREIRAGELNREVPVVVVTVVAERGAVAGFAVSDILSKPVSPANLLRTLLRAGIAPDREGAILVLDDDPGALRLMAATLGNLGYESRCETDGERALDAADAAMPRAVVLDLRMPGMSGFEFLERFRRDPRRRRVPVIVWTGKDLSSDEIKRLRRSAQAIVLKTDGGGAVIAELEACLGREESYAR